MLEKVLGEHLPNPPANVGQVKPNQPGENLTFRERFELHRSDATCAICHNKIDPLGFAMQAYDSTGAYNPTGLIPTKGKNRKQKKNKAKEDELALVDPPLLDTSGRLPGGQSFEDFRELKQILLTSQRRRIIENIVKRTLSYALARELNVQFAPTVVFFDAAGQEVMRLDGAFRTFHTQGILRYVNNKAYLEQPSFQRYLGNLAEHWREQGLDVDIWSYDLPVSRNGEMVVVH